MSIQYWPDLLSEESDPDFGSDGLIVDRLLSPNQPAEEPNRHPTSQKPKDHNFTLAIRSF